ncbi:hypothetical protein BD769DRAFT_1387403 [Suillus cothurnatus]|nr:hypothetical protein BD769DRAFT_1387403 [Suillus cothurnatus]
MDRRRRAGSRRWRQPWLKWRGLRRRHRECLLWSWRYRFQMVLAQPEGQGQDGGSRVVRVGGGGRVLKSLRRRKGIWRRHEHGSGNSFEGVRVPASIWEKYFLLHLQCDGDLGCDTFTVTIAQPPSFGIWISTPLDELTRKLQTLIPSDVSPYIREQPQAACKCNQTHEKHPLLIPDQKPLSSHPVLNYPPPLTQLPGSLQAVHQNFLLPESVINNISPPLECDYPEEAFILDLDVDLDVYEDSYISRTRTYARRQLLVPRFNVKVVVKQSYEGCTEGSWGFVLPASSLFTIINNVKDCLPATMMTGRFILLVGITIDANTGDLPLVSLTSIDAFGSLSSTVNQTRLQQPTVLFAAS